MSDLSGVYHVLLKGGAPGNWQPAAAIISDCAPKIGKPIVIKALRFGHGLLRLMLTKDEAELVAAKLTAANLPAQAVAMNDIVQPTQPYTMLRLELTDAALNIQIGASTVFQPVPWETIRLLHVGCVRVKSKPMVGTLDADTVNNGVSIGLTAIALVGGINPVGVMMAAKHGMDIARRDATQKVGDTDAGPTETEVLLEIFTLAPMVRLRIRQSKFSYEFLGERRQPIARSNFALLLAELKARATNAAVTGLFPLAVAGRRIEPEKSGVDEGENDQQLSAFLTCECTVGLPRG